jgi:DNA repair exonuclease SbcCD nuclease subunit
MKVLATSDLHLSARQRDQYRFDACKKLTAIIAREKPDAVLIAGDLTEEKDRHPAELVNRVVDLMHGISKLAPLLILKANHDYRDEAHPFFAFLSHVENVHWIGSACDAAQLPKQFRKPFAGCLFLPHTHHPKRDWKGWVDRTTFRFVFAHQLFSGAVGDTGKRLSGIDPALIPANQYVLSGDVHRPGMVGGNIEYIGAPYHVDFGDNYTSRFIEFKSNSSNRKVTTRRTDKWPQKRLIAVDSYRELFDATGNPGDIVVVRINTTKEKFADDRKEVVRWAKQREIELHRVDAVFPNKAVRRNVSVAHTRADDSKVVRQFCKRHGVDERSERLGHSLVEDVK